jgi:hypothetical protein
MFFQNGFAFTTAREVWVWAISNAILCLTAKAGMGAARKSAHKNSENQFRVVRRFFYYISEADVAALLWCTSPRFLSCGASSDDPNLPSKVGNILLVALSLSSQSRSLL